ncbi:MAG: carboxylesterase/lipase family protein [Myxococcota bacterium]
MSASIRFPRFSASASVSACVSTRAHAPRTHAVQPSRLGRPMLAGLLGCIALGLGVLGCSASKPMSDPATTRTLAQGELIGAASEEGQVHVWRGIPFAEPPVGALRWRAPQPPLAWEGRREALTSGSECAQLSAGQGDGPFFGSEDCLYLDIFAPAFGAGEVPTGTARKPVMFWIHGGGNSMGAGNQLPVDALARDNDVIVVTINYRLGVFGWLSHPALRASAETPEDASGNFGTLDMVRALEWVRDNISEFGGDPGSVTIFGESAGGVNVYSLLASPKAKGLFHAGIAESGVPSAMTRAQSENFTDDAEAIGLPGSSSELLIALLRGEGKAASREAAKEIIASMDDAAVEAFLRSFSYQELLQPFIDVMAGETMPMYMSPNVFRDGTVIVDAPLLETLGTKGAYNEVPFMAGTNREESKLFLLLGDSPHVSTTLGIPSGLSNERLYDVEGEYGGLMWRAIGADEPLSAMRKAQGPSVWGYRFDWDEQPTVMGADLSKLLGAAHAMEMFFVFGLQDLGFFNRFVYDDVDSAALLSKQMRSYWSNFAHTHAPGQGQEGELPLWEPWGLEAEDPKYIIFDSERDGGLEVGRDQVDQGYVMRRAEKDPRLFNDEERCRVFKNFLQWSDSLTMEDYDGALDGACAAFPVESRLMVPSLDHTNAF